MSIIYKTRTQLVVETLREKILSGEIKAGQPLRQAALAEELNVSRIPIREALLQLEGEGLVAFEPHKGATATELNADQVDELFELRAMLVTKPWKKRLNYSRSSIKRWVKKMPPILGASLILVIIIVCIRLPNGLKPKF